jgi:hypothetical protein
MSRRSRHRSANGLVDRRALLRGAALAGGFLSFVPRAARAAAPPDLGYEGAGREYPYGAPAK